MMIIKNTIMRFMQVVGTNLGINWLNPISCFDPKVSKLLIPLINTPH